MAADASAPERSPCRMEDPAADYQGILDYEPASDAPVPQGVLRAATRFRARDDAPTFEVAYVGEQEVLYELRLSRPGETSPVQTLELDGPDFHEGSEATALDVDRDGYNDLLLHTATGTGYLYDYVWLYDAEGGRLGTGFVFNGLAVDSATGAVTSFWKEGAGTHGLSMYTFERRRPVLVRQWVTDNWGDMETTYVCEPRGGEMVVLETRPGWDWHDAPGEEE